MGGMADMSTTPHINKVLVNDMATKTKEPFTGASVEEGISAHLYNLLPTTGVGGLNGGDTINIPILSLRSAASLLDQVLLFISLMYL